MAKLVLSLQGRMLSEFELNKENITIGRKPDNDIHIDNLAVSGHHAVVHTLFNQAFLEDLNSTNGTLVNNETITKRALKEGDVVTIGKHELKYVAGGGVAEEDNPFDRTVVIRSPLAGAAPPPPKPAAAAFDPNATTQTKSTPAAAPAASAMVAKVAILSGPDKGKEFSFTKPVTTFGKKGVQVAAVSQKPEGYYIQHMEGASTPTVNGESIGSRTVLLKEYDVLEVAGIKMTFLVS
ncbi:MAG: FHA domain-containing protein [Methylococcaceae bacterium]|nr:MAG: FHA domain-containing protein [Methylococcaceae bacterium]